MNLLEWIFGGFKKKPQTYEEKRKAIERKRAEAQIRLARERDKSFPDPMKIDRFERELRVWDEQLKKHLAKPRI